MTHLKHTFASREALSKTWHRRRDHYVTISNTILEEADDPGYVHLTHTIRSGKGWSQLTIEIGNEDFGVVIDRMMRAHPEATIRAIGATLAEFRQTKDASP